MAEQQLVDYIKKARQAGQSDNQSRSLLYKNGWTETEVSEAISVVDQASVQPESQFRASLELESQAKPEYQISDQPEAKIQQEPVQQETVQPQTQYQPQYKKYESQFAENNTPRAKKGAGLILKFIIVFIVLAIVGVGGYFAIMQQTLIKGFFSIFSPHSAEIIKPAPLDNKDEINKESEIKEEPPQLIELLTQKIISVPEEYDATKITIAAFSKNGSKVVYCVPQKVNNKITCFLNDYKLLDNPYNFKPYWIGISPNEQRVIFLYYDSVKKQSFTFENRKEGRRYNGTITSPKFSDDSQNFIYMVIGNDGKNFVVINDKPSAPYDKIYTIPEFNSEGNYVLYGARIGQDILWVADKIEKPKINEEIEETKETEEEIPK